MKKTALGKTGVSLRRFVSVGIGLLVILAFLAACGGKSQPTASPTVEPATPTVTPAPPRSLTVCMTNSPGNLFPLNNPYGTARSILSAVYDGPIDATAYGYQAVILQRIPSLENGDAQVFSKTVSVGDEVVDASGAPITLAPGARVLPAGCREAGCAVEYDGTGELQMDQVQVTFRLLPGLAWSDGEPLTADDSVYSYQVASTLPVESATMLDLFSVINRTQAYEAADEVTVQWWGKPGFVDPTYAANFFFPLPKHAWEQIPVDELLSSDESSVTPLGWGAYMFDVSQSSNGDIVLVKNPYYFRAGEGLPKFDTLTFHFVPDAQTAVDELAAGTCDLIDPNTDLEGQAQSLRDLAGQGQLQVMSIQTTTLEQLAFGIVPASYDNTYNPDFDRLDFFGDVRLRQAVALCLDRQQVVDSVLFGSSSVPVSFVPGSSPLFDAEVKTYPLDIEAGKALLEQAGWRDLDGVPTTPRQAWGVRNVPDGTLLELNYLTTHASQRVQASAILADSLAQCGIQVNLQYVDQDTLYAAGPDGPLFGRNFDLAEFAMGSAGVESPCAWFSSDEVPNAANYWIGTNVSGYSNASFDAACQTAGHSLMDEALHAEAYGQAQSIFAEELPVIPLYWRVKIAAARPEVCGFALDPTTSNPLWNIESFDSGAGCQP